MSEIGEELSIQKNSRPQPGKNHEIHRDLQRHTEGIHEKIEKPAADKKLNSKNDEMNSETPYDSNHINLHENTNDENDDQNDIDKTQTNIPIKPDIPNTLRLSFNSPFKNLTL